MIYKKTIAVSFSLFTSLFLLAQGNSVQADIRKMGKESDPVKIMKIRDQIIKDHELDSLKDSETFDMLNGAVAITLVMKKNYQEFQQNISLIKNRFNQTSILSMAANELLDKNIDADYACKIAKETLENYFSFKDDPAARPEGYTKEDWVRFMNNAEYPYYDTYAKSLFALKRYKEALKYQLKAFDGKPEEGIPSSIERYTKLLELNGDSEKSKQLLLKIARMGKLNKGMIAQLESFYISENGTTSKFDFYIDSLQNGIQAAMVTELKKNMLNEIAPAFSLNDITGKRVRLADYKGKIVIIDLWATWCVPCIASFPAMQKQVEKHSDVVFLFIAVEENGTDALEKVKTFIHKNNYPFHVLMDESVNKASNKYKVISSYKPNGIPAKYVIDREGKLRFKSGGFDTDLELINEIDAMISIVKNL